MTLHFTLILQVNTHCIARYIDSKMPLGSISKHLFFKIFFGDMLPDPPNICLLYMVIVVCTITHNHSCTMKLHFDHVA